MSSIGSRVSLRYRLPAGLTDVIGHLEALTPIVLVRTKTGELVEIEPDDVVSVRELSYAPVRNSQIRDLARIEALARPAAEQCWASGWLLRADPSAEIQLNSAAPLEFSAGTEALAEIIDWYTQRGLPAWLDLPERLLPIRATGVSPSRILTLGEEYVRVPDDDATAIVRFEAMGYRLHHRARYVLASDILR